MPAMDERQTLKQPHEPGYLVVLQYGDPGLMLPSVIYAEVFAPCCTKIVSPQTHRQPFEPPPLHTQTQAQPPPPPHTSIRSHPPHQHEMVLGWVDPGHEEGCLECYARRGQWHIPLSTRIRGGFGGYGCLFFSQHLWGFFEVADLGYLFVFFNSTRIY